VFVEGYIRVSDASRRHGERFISPVEQREAIERWADQRGFSLMEVYEELDESGARADRPLLEQAVSRIEARVSNGLVVTHVDRFGRSLLDGLQVIERIRACDGEFYAVADGLDTSTDAGRLACQILLSTSEYALARIRAGWDTSRRHAVRRGVWMGNTTPVGYRRTRSGRLRPHPITGPLITDLYRQRASGTGLRTLCRWLEQEGVLTAKGNPGWGDASLRRVLTMRAYLGEVYHGPYVKPGAHQPLTDAAMWERAQRPRPREHNHLRVPTLLAGLVRCASCSHMLVSRWTRADPTREPYRVYGCCGYHAASPCPAPAYISATQVEPYVIENCMDILRRRRRPPTGELTRSQTTATEAADALARYRDNDRLAAMLGQEAFPAGIAIRAARLRQANLAWADATARVALHDLPSVAQARRLLLTTDVLQRRELLSKIVDVVFVAPGRRHPERRVTLCPIGTAPDRLPTKGDKGRNHPIRPRRGWINPGEGRTPQHAAYKH
jgi:DNA invertase Pin-like site-specific DNA recombinase